MMTMVAQELHSGCGVCGKKNGLLQCSSCKVMSYCSRAHQVADRPAHKSACSAIKRARGKMEREEQILQNHPEHSMIDPHPLINNFGEFWSIIRTRDYTIARFGLIEAMTGVHNAQSVQAQLDHFMDMLRLCRTDNMGLRYLVPGLMLRLNKDQECYDFIKWWVDYDWGDKGLPYPYFRNADVFETPKQFFPSSDLSHLTCLCLLKIKLFFEIMRLEQSTLSLGPVIPREILDLINSFVPQSPIIRNSHDIMHGSNNFRNTMLDKLEVQIDEIFHAVAKTNQYFWLALIDDEYDSTNAPDSYIHGSLNEAAWAMHINYQAWAETPGAIDLIKVKINGDI